MNKLFIYDCLIFLLSGLARSRDVAFEIVGFVSDKVVFYGYTTNLEFKLNFLEPSKPINQYNAIYYNITEDKSNQIIKSGLLVNYTYLAEYSDAPASTASLSFKISDILLQNKVYHHLVLSVKSGEYVKNKEIILTGMPSWVTLLPIAVLLSVAIYTGNGMLSLAIGLLVSSSFVNGFNPLRGFLRFADTYIISPLVSDEIVKMMMFQYFLCGLIGMMQKGGGALGLTKAIGSFANSRWSAQWTVFISSMVIFFDEYSTILIIGPNMRPITDLMNVSREKLAFIVHGTSAPLACISPISSWIGFQLSLISAQLSVLDISEEPLWIFLMCISHFYFVIFLFVFMISMFLLKKDFGPMLSAERKASKSELLSLPTIEACQPRLENMDKTPKRWINAAVPIATIVVVTVISIFFTGYYNLEKENHENNIPNHSYKLMDMIGRSDTFSSLLYSIFFACILSFSMLKIQGIMSIAQGIEVFIEGIKDFVDPLLVLILAWGIGESYKHLKCADYIASVFSDSIDYRLMPMVIFLVAFAIGFSTGTSWGAMTVIFPLVLPYVWNNTSQNMDIFIESTASIFSGAIAGETASPVAGTTLLSSIVCKLESKDHFISQLPYIITVSLISLVTCTIPVSYGIYPHYIGLVVGTIIILATVFFIGVNPESNKEDFMTRCVRKAKLTFRGKN